MSEQAAVTAEDLIRDAKHLGKGNLLEDFTVGRVFEHHWGRTITQAENALYSTLTLHFNPHYFNREHARVHGHEETVVNPLLVFNTVFGLSVEDLSEAGMGPFLGVDELEYLRPVYADDTLVARSTVVDVRDTRSRPEFGIVTWHTEGFNQFEDQVISFRRANLVQRRAAGES